MLRAFGQRMSWRLVSALFLTLAFLSSHVLGASPESDRTVLAITINGEAKGDFFVVLTSDGDYLVRLSDIDALGMPGIKGARVDFEGEPHISLRSANDVRYHFNERSLTLEISAAAELLGRSTVDLLPPRRRKVIAPQAASAFFNYQLDYSAGDGAPAALGLASELGARVGNWLLLSGMSQGYSERGDSRSVRLMSNLTLDRRPQLQRLVLGDFFTTSGELGSTLNLGGLSFSKRYSIDPYLVRKPTAAFNGVVSSPSEAEIYLDGIRIGTQRLPAGEFSIQNIDYYGGARDIAIVIKDRFGRVQRLDYSYYFADTLLGEGLHEYSYDLGMMRLGYGLVSNNYGELAASAFHRFGFSNALTLGLRGEAAGGRANMGPQAALRLGPLGILSGGFAFSHGPRVGSGRAAQLSYAYEERAFSARALVRHLSDSYVQAMPVDTLLRPRFEAGAGLGYGSRRIGNFGIDVGTTSRVIGDRRQSVSLSYSRSIVGNLSLLVTLSHINDTRRANEAFVSLSWSPGKDLIAGYLHQGKSGSESDMFQFGKNAPVGEGWGYSLSAERQRVDSGQFTVISPSIQYNGTQAVYTADYREARDGVGRQTSYRLGMAGALGYVVGGAYGLSRPINDSFGVVKVGELSDVRVYQNNQVIGRTDASGTLFVPNFGSYLENQVAIEDKDIPIEYAISDKERYVSPPLRSGSLIEFSVARIQAFTGTLKLKADGSVKPAEYYEGNLGVGNNSISFATGKGGVIYVENIPPGRHQGSVSAVPGGCHFTVTVPASKETLVDLGEMVCEPAK